MIEIRIVLASAFMAVCLVLVATITAGAQTTGDESTDLERSASRPSQGTVTGATRAQLDAVRRDLAEEERLPNYTGVVDDTSGWRFDAPGWRGRPMIWPTAAPTRPRTAVLVRRVSG